ncbi:MAG: ABC transporter substrate-binding protein [Anaerolineae bacterium]|nr:ABC transporter substrate-binding protein [Anaerolineae bacterium]
MKFVRFLMVFAIAALLAVDGVSAQDQQDLTFFLTFVPNVQFSPLYVAIDNGYFSEVGLNLTIEHGDEPLGVDLIASGQRQFGMISGEQVIAARAQARPVVFVYEWFQAYPVGIAVPVEQGITTVDGLRGHVVGIPGRFGASYSGLTALLAANGMTETDIQLEEIGFNAPEAICTARVEAAVVYSNNEPLQIRNRAAAGDCGSVTDVVVIPVADAADMVSNGIVTNEDTVANEPDLVASVVGAFDQGLRDTINNPAAAYLSSVNYVENLPLSEPLSTALITAADDQNVWLTDNLDATRAEVAARRAELRAALGEQFTADELVQFDVLLASIEFWDADQLGISTLDSWQVTQDTLSTMNFLPAPIDLEAAFTNDFVPAAAE